MQPTTAQALQALFLEALSRGERPAGDDAVAAEFAQRAMAAVGATGPDLGLGIRPEINRFFSYNPDNGSLLHPTADEAREASRLDIAYYRGAAKADGEWPVDVENVCWGEIRGRAVPTGDENGVDFHLVGDDAPAAPDELSVASLVMTGRLKASRLFPAMAACGLGSITMNQRIDVDAMAALLDHLLGAKESEGEQAALDWIAAFFKDKGFYPSLVQAYVAGRAAGPEDKMGVEVAARRSLALELSGVLADMENGHPFDELSLSTVTRVRDSLYVDPAGVLPRTSITGWPGDVALWVEEQRYRREGPLTEEELSQLLLRKFGSLTASSCTLAELVFAFNAALLARRRPSKNNGQASDYLSTGLLRQLECAMVKLGIAPGDGGQEHFAAQLEYNLQMLCGGIDRVLEAEPAATQMPAGVALQSYRIGKGSDAIMVECAQQMSGPDRWAVRRHGNVLSKQGEWEYEPMPSSRDDEFLERCRFASAAEAMEAALAAARADDELRRK